MGGGDEGGGRERGRIRGGWGGGRRGGGVYILSKCGVALQGECFDLRNGKWSTQREGKDCTIDRETD